MFDNYELQISLTQEEYISSFQTQDLSGLNLIVLRIVFVPDEWCKNAGTQMNGL